METPKQTTQTNPAVDNNHSILLIKEIEEEKSLLLLLSKDITSCRTKQDIQQIVSERLAKYFRFNEIMICLDNTDNLTHTNYIHTITEQTIQHPSFAKGVAMKYYINDGIYNVIQTAEEPVIFDMYELMRRSNRPYYVDFFYELNVNQLIGFPVRVNNKSFGAVFVYVKEKIFFSPSEIKLAEAVCAHISIAISNILAYEQIQNQLAEIKQYKSRLEQENLYLQEQMSDAVSAGDIIGAATSLKKVFQLIANVARTNSTVLIMGETGTGKELIARAIHNTSGRKDKLMIKVNCAALPAQLIESELFGHEKGSFTGATERRMGKFELADNSTLFLDEIGEMSLDLQVKFLRAIQEKEVERIGGQTVIKTDVRIIAATNRDLEKEVAAGRFRADLYYRLNVFPIVLPPLRHRKEDIDELIAYFIHKLTPKIGKKITGVAPAVLKEFHQYDWPGNIRELENVIERSILMATGPCIEDIHLVSTVKEPSVLPEEQDIKSLEQVERQHIVATLKKCNGRIRGEKGAAAMLNLPPTTLQSKMKKLGINKEY
ncbi:sigma 54-interacting transcriptional regulator [Pinibacter soli]|uniref:Sigma 54-interacting transcriptional regulator n=1 Tax=Pinibacter soli TaxID=3044211 RepID=A0ABT6REI0_9BACT|nr:sigma 54-interacting transcriptional regulator [Pinibacter soli]MDI3320881.1 sigma 54-interacting transcriptional regulator [Pinibacter soli]